MPNSWTDQDRIWHTGNGHGLKISTPLEPQGAFGGDHGVTNSKMWERSQTAGPIGNTFGTRMHIHLGMDMSLTINPLIPEGHGG